MRIAVPSTGPSIDRDESDLTARARIRDSAIECFAAEGFRASVRTIADRARVSPGLITHHFGSKAALRAECDAEVLRRFRELKADAMTMPTSQLFGVLTDLDANGPVLVYMLRSIQVGGQVGRDFVEHVIDDARQYMADGIAKGIIRPSRDEEARLRYLTYQTMGALLMEFTFAAGATGAAIDMHALLERIKTETILPTLEVFTEGLLTSGDMLDSFLAYREAHP